MNTTPRTVNDWMPETRSLCRALLDAGFAIHRGTNGENALAYTAGHLAEFVENLIACDESRLYVQAPDGDKLGLFLVLGNSPGEIVCDHTCHPLLETVLDAHYVQWSDREQPTRPAAPASKGGAL